MLAFIQFTTFDTINSALTQTEVKKQQKFQGIAASD